MGSWARVGESSRLRELVARRIRPSDEEGYVGKLWVGDGDALSWARDGCGPSSARCLAGGDIPSDYVSLAHISVRASSVRCRLFIEREMSSGDWPVWAGSLWNVFFCKFWCI